MAKDINGFLTKWTQIKGVEGTEGTQPYFGPVINEILNELAYKQILNRNITKGYYRREDFYKEHMGREFFGEDVIITCDEQVIHPIVFIDLFNQALHEFSIDCIALLM